MNINLRRGVLATNVFEVGAALLLTALPAEARTVAARDCKLAYSSMYPGPNGETEGEGRFSEGAQDPTGRTCRDGWWEESPEQIQAVQDAMNPFQSVQLGN